MNWKIWLGGMAALVILTACTPKSTPSVLLQATATPLPAVTIQPTPAIPTKTLPPTEVATLPAATSTAEPTRTLNESTPAVDQIVIDHTSLVLFDQIPDEKIAEAAKIRLLFRHASVGENINFGLSCLWGNYAGRRPGVCSDFYNLKYDRSNWVFQFRGNPGWIEKVDDFVVQTDLQAEQFDALTFTLGYLDGLDGMTYPTISDEENFQKHFVEPLEALEARHPDKIFIYWTMSLARQGHANTTKFNEMLRGYAREHGKILIDIADIESHDPDGSLVTDANGNPIISDFYTDEVNAGHLNTLGREVMAKAFWVLMARVAGWDGE